MTADQRRRPVRFWTLLTVIILLGVGLATWLFLPVALEEHCAQLVGAPETCLDLRHSPAGIPTAFSLWFNALGATIGVPIIVIVVLRFVRAQRATPPPAQPGSAIAPEGRAS
ncbi:hypothetical protein [Pseudoclavibacter sp. AY1H1]|uniref:hypothetical protein n=1 Tax=Pseudoclavibacter sp. AY1H1 TaxID=2080584 RepID=UPI000CE84C43|nr:hypothetical protein [Pseudoclavibacter sp. AY1H1]PPF33390.1 hypothetical protein C5E05_17745 [Pseudoclavibacter sp. AY1H1]